MIHLILIIIYDANSQTLCTEERLIDFSSTDLAREDKLAKKKQAISQMVK